MVGALVNPAVEQEGEGEADHQKEGGQVDAVGDLHRFGHHVKGHDAQHQTRSKGKQQAGGLGGFPLEQRGQSAAKSQSAHPCD